jgi:hypothetical protein
MPRLIGRAPKPAAHAPRSTPDPWPMRFALGLGGVAALSALATAIVMPPSPPEPDIAAVDPTDAPTAADTAGPTPTVRYIQLRPGETAPPGATVIPAPTSSAGTVVVSLTTTAPRKIATVTKTAAPKPVATPKTKQSATPKP